jgi:hypothetical protein
MIDLLGNEMKTDNWYKETMESSCQIDIDKLSNIYKDIFGNISNGYFVEVGSFEGKMFSNTYGLSQLGWGGLYIDPVPANINQCKINHAFNSKIQYFDKPIGKEFVTNVPFYTGDWASTLCKDVVKVNGHLSEDRFIMTDVYPLDWVLEKFKVLFGFHLLVVDCEGSDMDVMHGFSIQKYYPKLVIIEYNQERFNEFEEYFKENDYDLIFRDTSNLIYRRD